MMARRQKSLGFLLLILSGCGQPKNSTGIERVILISCDTLRADRLGVYGYKHDVSPNLDRFAEDCIVFSKAYSTAPTTSPAMSSVFTGRYPDELGVRGNRVQMPPEIETLAESLRRAGIETAAVVSNWVLSRDNAARGAGVSQGFQHYDDRMTSNWSQQRGEEATGSTPVPGTSLPDRGAKETTDATFEWLEKRRSDRFFLWVHYQDPHGPYTPPETDIQALDRPLTNEPPLPLGKRQSGFGKLPLYQALGEERRPEFYRIRYDAEIRYFDRELGRLLDELEAEGLLDGTLVIFTADHGESLGEHDHWFAHSQHIYSEVVHIPFLVRYPAGTLKPTTRKAGPYRYANQAVSQTDVMATVTEAFGLSPPPSQGTSLLTDTLPTSRILAQMGAGWYGITDGMYRLKWNEKREIFLFDIDADKGELHDLSKREPERVREMMKSFEAARSKIPVLNVQGIRTKDSEANARALEALGYGGGEDD